MTTAALAAALRRLADIASSTDRAAVLAEAADRLAELAEDKARLDFIEAHGLTLEPETCRSPKWWRVSRLGWQWDYHGDDARQAIDQAREHRQ